MAGAEFGPRLDEIPALTISIQTVSVATLLAGAYAYIIDLELREPSEIYRNRSLAMGRRNIATTLLQQPKSTGTCHTQLPQSPHGPATPKQIKQRHDRFTRCRSPNSGTRGWKTGHQSCSIND